MFRVVYGQESVLLYYAVAEVVPNVGRRLPEIQYTPGVAKTHCSCVHFSEFNVCCIVIIVRCLTMRCPGSTTEKYVPSCDIRSVSPRRLSRVAYNMLLNVGKKTQKLQSNNIYLQKILNPEIKYIFTEQIYFNRK